MSRRLLLLLLLQFSLHTHAVCGNKDSLLNITRIHPNDTQCVNALNTLSIIYRNAGDQDSAMICAGRAGELSAKLHFSRGELTSKDNYAECIYDKGDFIRCLELYTEYYEMAKAQDNKKVMGLALNDLGITQRQLGNVKEALAYYYRSLAIYESIKDSTGISSVENNIGLINETQGNLNEAMTHFNKGLGYVSLPSKKLNAAYFYTNIAVIYSRKKIEDSALFYFRKALAIYDAEHFLIGVAKSYTNIGSVYFNMKEFDSSMYYQQLALGIKEKIGYTKGIGISNLDIGDLYMNMHAYGKAGECFRKALDIAKQVQSKEDLSAAYQALSNYDSATGDFRNSLLHYRMYIAYRDSISNDENTKKTVQTQMLYEFSKQTESDSIRNAEQFKREQLKHEQEIKQQRIFTFGGAAGFLLMLVIAVISFRAYRNKQHANEIITGQKILVEEKQKEILDSIEYAKRIQRSLLPTERYIERHLRRD